METKLQYKLKSLAIFRNILSQPIVIRLQQLLSDSQEKDMGNWIDSYSDFVNCIYENGDSLSSIVFKIVMEDENIYVKKKAANMAISKTMEDSLNRELDILQEVLDLTSESVLQGKNIEIDLPSWDITSYSLKEEYSKRMEEISKFGYGMYAKYHMFVINEGKIQPIRYPDSQRLEDLHDYEIERNKIIRNTEALLEGGTASNVLLYGDAGTGKSSSIKAIVNAYKDQGLRLIEVKKTQLYQIPDIIEELSANPLKFILFIDDLSFTSNDENFAALKSILEGSVSALGNNVVIYATSNRRHLIREDFKSRQGDEIHLNDTIQETMSLSSRFGLTITFSKPDKKVYLHIVHELAKKYGVDMDEKELDVKAEAYAIRHSGRSPRTAKQFIEQVKAGI